MVAITFCLDQECVKTPEKAFGTASQHIHKAGLSCVTEPRTLRGVVTLPLTDWISRLPLLVRLGHSAVSA
jgi:hypothetical protein